MYIGGYRGQKDSCASCLSSGGVGAGDAPTPFFFNLGDDMLTWTGVGSQFAMTTALNALLDLMFPTAPAYSHFRLYQNNYTPNEASAISDFVVADFTGYAEAQIDDAQLPTPRFDSEGNLRGIDLTVQQFLQSGTTINNTVYGFFWLNTSGTGLLAAGRFTTPILFDHVGKSIDLEIGIRLNTGSLVIGTDLEESV